MRKSLLGLTALALLLAGCGGQSPAPSGTPEPAPVTSSSAAKNDGPPISNPRNAEAFLTKPCELLTNAQLTELNVATSPPGKPSDTTPGVKGCARRASGQGISVGVSDHSSFADIEQQNKNDPGYSRSEIDGYPSIRIKDQTGGACQAWVGVSAKRMIFVFNSATDGVLRGRDVCEFAQQVAGAAIKNLQPA